MLSKLQITKTVDEKVDKDAYVPIVPTRKNRRTQMQLKFAHDVYGDTGLPFRSYLRVDAVYEAPMEVLEEQLSFGRHLQLKQQSFDSLHGFMMRRRLAG
jgi:hypothetical protein